MPEKKEGKVYNTATVFSPEGFLLSTYSKVAYNADWHIKIANNGNVNLQ